MNKKPIETIPREHLNVEAFEHAVRSLGQSIQRNSRLAVEDRSRKLLKPWNWATVPGHRNPVELVSYVIPNDGDSEDTIMVRMKPGDPTSIKEIPVSGIEPFDPKEHPWYYRERTYYNDNPTAYWFTDELPRNTASKERRDIERDHAEVYSSQQRLEIQKILLQTLQSKNPRRWLWPTSSPAWRVEPPPRFPAEPKWRRLKSPATECSSRAATPISISRSTMRCCFNPAPQRIARKAHMARSAC